MTDIPIIFSGPMVRALLAGRKTRTRRLAWSGARRNIFGVEFPSPWRKVRPGDRLWVRESVRVPPPITDRLLRDGADTWPAIMYDADLDQQDRDWCSEHAWKSRPSIHMPRWASRLTLIVEATKIEPLQDISEEDVVAEGLATLSKDAGRTWKFGIADRDGLPGRDDDGWPWAHWSTDHKQAFARLWDSIHGEDAWSENPDVIALTFRVIAKNIDQVTP